VSYFLIGGRIANNAGKSLDLSAFPVVNLTPPSWPATVTFGQQAILTMGTWQGNIDAQRSLIFLLQPLSTGVRGTTNYKGALPNTLYVHTPGSPAVAGDTIYIEERVYAPGTPLATIQNDSDGSAALAKATSAGIVITAQVDPFIATVAISNYVTGEDAPVAPFTPIVFSGGTPPYSNIAASPALPAGFALNTGNGQITGTPINPQTQIAITISGRDSTGQTAQGTFNLTVTSASSGSLVALPIPCEGIVSGFGSSTTYSGTALQNAGGVHLGPVVDPTGAGATGPWRVHRVKDDATNYPPISGSSAWRAELAWALDQYRFLVGVDHWLAWVYYMPSTEAVTEGAIGVTNDELVNMQVHTPFGGATTPSFAYGMAGQPITGALHGRRFLRTAGNTTTVAAGGSLPSGGNISNADIILPGLPQVNTLVSVIAHWRPGWASSYSPRIDLWERFGNGVYNVSINNYTNLTGYNYLGANASWADYPRLGIYKFSETQGNWRNPAISFTMTPLFYARSLDGSSLFTAAQTAIANAVGF